MKIEDITQFKSLIANMSIEELNNKRKDLQNQLSRMILDSEIVMQIAIVEAKLKEKEENNG